MEVYFSGTIERIIFENPSNFYRILLLEIDDTDAEDFDDFEIIVTGTMADVIEGEDYTFWGQIVQHSKYGEQLQISRYERAKPTSKGLVKYFSSSHFKGIGLKTAQKIVDTYGDNTIDEILQHPEKLEDITGLSAKNREAFLSTLRLNYGTEMVLAKLANYGIPNKLAFQIQDFLLHHPDYGDKELQEQKEEYFDEIFECFYDDLPRDEKMIVDCLQAIDEVRATDNEQYGIALLDESFEELWNQREFSFSDLLKIRLYFLCSYLENIKKGRLSISEQQKLQLMFQKVCNNVENSGTDDLFLVRDVLFAGVSLVTCAV